jgi:hypothetical protein
MDSKIYIKMYWYWTLKYTHQSFIYSPTDALVSCLKKILKFYTKIHHHHHHHDHVREVLGVFPVPWSSRGSWSLHLFLGRPMFLRPFGLYCSACFGILSVPIPCTCCNPTLKFYIKIYNKTAPTCFGAVLVYLRQLTCTSVGEKIKFW